MTTKPPYEVLVFTDGDKRYTRKIVAESEDETERQAMAEVEQQLRMLGVQSKVTSARAFPDRN